MEGSPLERALERIRISYLWQLFGLCGSPEPSCRSPFREDRHPSFSVYEGGRKWKDHATGARGDAADFLAAACKVTRREGCRLLIAMAGNGGTNGSGKIGPASR